MNLMKDPLIPMVGVVTDIRIDTPGGLPVRPIDLAAGVIDNTFFRKLSCGFGMGVQY